MKRSKKGGGGDDSKKKGKLVLEGNKDAAAAADGKKEKNAKKKKKSLLSSIFDGSTLGLVVMVIYLYTTVKSMRSLLFPLQGLEIPASTPRINPFWGEDDQLQVLAYLSTSSKPNPRQAFNTSNANFPLVWDSTAAWTQTKGAPEEGGSIAAAKASGSCTGSACEVMLEQPPSK